MEALDEFYFGKEEPLKSCLLALRDIILGTDGGISACQKYGMPCFCVGKKALCYLWTDKKTQEPYILFVDGQHLEHQRLEHGNRARMKILRLPSEEDLPLKIIQELIKKAISFLND